MGFSNGKEWVTLIASARWPTHISGGARLEPWEMVLLEEEALTQFPALWAVPPPRGKTPKLPRRLGSEAFYCPCSCGAQSGLST